MSEAQVRRYGVVDQARRFAKGADGVKRGLQPSKLLGLEKGIGGGANRAQPVDKHSQAGAKND